MIRQLAHYGCPEVNTKAIPLQPLTYLLIVFLGLTLTPWFKQAMMDFTRPLWAGRHPSYSIGLHGQLILC